jgi:hypothetical protein
LQHGNGPRRRDLDQEGCPGGDAFRRLRRLGFGASAICSAGGPIRPLLDDVGELMGEKFPPGLCIGGRLVAEDHVFAEGVGTGSQFAGRGRRAPARVNSDAAEAVAEARLEKGAGGRVQRLAG